jgi:ubiquitin-protein ligase
LNRLAAANPEYVEIVDRRPSPTEDVFKVRLHQSPGVEKADGRTVRTRDVHSLRLSFTRFYPEVPVECYIDEPLFHPNVKRETGFICLWEHADPRYTVIQALARTQAIAAYRMVNTGSAHLMNKDAAAWYQDVAAPQKLVPLTWDEMKVFEVQDGQIRWLEPGRQLTASRTRLS